MPRTATGTRTKRATTSKTTVKRATAGKTTVKRTATKTKTSAGVKRTTAKTSATATRAKRSTTRTSSAAAKSSAVARRPKSVPNAAFMAPMQPDADLAAIVGKKPLPRTQVTKKVWAYIKKHDLQDATHRRVIVADAKLRPILGNRRRVDMFQMTKLINQHLADIG